MLYLIIFATIGLVGLIQRFPKYWGSVPTWVDVITYLSVLVDYYKIRGYLTAA